MSGQYSPGDLARHLGIPRSHVFRELQSFPHTRVAGEITFSAEQVGEIERMLSAGPDEELARLQLLESKRARLQAEDDLKARDEPPEVA